MTVSELRVLLNAFNPDKEVVLIVGTSEAKLLTVDNDAEKPDKLFLLDDEL